MSLSIDLLSLIDQLIAIINNAYLALVSYFWYYSVKFGLSPEYAYGMILNPPAGFMALYRFIMQSVYSIVLEFVLIGVSVTVLIKNSAGIALSIESAFIRYSFAVLVFLTAYKISHILVEISLYGYEPLWNYGGTNWYSLFSSLNNANWNSTFTSGLHPSTAVLEFLFLSGYFVATLALMATLLIREALIYFLILLLPLFSVLFVFRSTQDLAVRFWRLFIESATLPIFIILALIAANIFHENFILQLAFLSLASSMPLLIAGSSGVFTSSSLNGILRPETARGMLSGGSSVASGMANLSLTSQKGAPLSAGRLLRSSAKGVTGPIQPPGSHTTNVSWKDISDRETGYRKKWVNGEK